MLEDKAVPITSLDSTPKSKEKIIVFGDGDLSYSVEFAKQNSPAHLTSTVYLSLEALVDTYGAGINDKISALNSAGANVLFEVDVTNLPDCLLTEKYDKVIFNFPHTGGKSKIHENRALLANLFQSVASIASGEVHIALLPGQGGTPADGERYRDKGNTWQIREAATNSGFILIRVEEFDTASYNLTGYRGSKKGFKCQKGLRHIFVRRPQISMELLREDSRLAEYLDPGEIENVFARPIIDTDQGSFSELFSLNITPTGKRRRLTQPLHLEVSEHFGVECTKDIFFPSSYKERVLYPIEDHHDVSMYTKSADTSPNIIPTVLNTVGLNLQKIVKKEIYHNKEKGLFSHCYRITYRNDWEAMSSARIKYMSTTLLVEALERDGFVLQSLIFLKELFVPANLLSIPMLDDKVPITSLDSTPKSKEKIIVFGDGDLSFSVEFAKQNSPAHLTSTVYLSLEALVDTYGAGINDKISALNSAGANVLFEVDVTNLPDCLLTEKYDKVIFNFPHTGGKSKIHENRALLANLFQSVASIASGEVHIALLPGQGGTPADGERYRDKGNTWQIREAATNSGFILIRVEEFDTASYNLTGYRGSKKGFKCQKGLRHIFVRRPQISMELLREDSRLAEYLDPGEIENVFARPIIDTDQGSFSELFSLNITPTGKRRRLTQPLHLEVSEHFGVECTKDIFFPSSYKVGVLYYIEDTLDVSMYTERAVLSPNILPTRVLLLVGLELLKIVKKELYNNKEKGLFSHCYRITYRNDWEAMSSARINNMSTAATVEAKLKEAFSPANLTVEDESDGCGAKISVVIVSDQFTGMSRLKRHKAVHAALKDEIPGIHAFSQKTLAPYILYERVG
eukprot:sb/3479566/